MRPLGLPKKAGEELTRLGEQLAKTAAVQLGLEGTSSLRPDTGSSSERRYEAFRNVMRVISGGLPRRKAKPGHSPVPLLTYSVMSPIR